MSIMLVSGVQKKAQPYISAVRGTKCQLDEVKE